MTFDIFDGIQELTVEVFDHEALSHDGLRGSKILDLSKVFSKYEEDATFSLTHQDKHAGDVHLVLYFKPIEGEHHHKHHRQDDD